MQRLLVFIPLAVRPTLLQQMDTGSLTRAQIWVRAVRTKGVRHKQVCTRFESVEQNIISLFVCLLKAYSPANRTGSPEGLHKTCTLLHQHNNTNIIRSSSSSSSGRLVVVYWWAHLSQSFQINSKCRRAESFEVCLPTDASMPITLPLHLLHTSTFILL